MNEYLVDSDMNAEEEDPSLYDRESHMLMVLNTILKWFVDRIPVIYAIELNKNGMIPNANVLKDSLDYTKYKESTENPLPKFKARSQMVAELEAVIEEEILPLQIGAFS